MGTLAVHSTQHLDCRGTASGDIIITLYRRLSCLECLVSYSLNLNVEVRGLEILMYLHTCNLVSDTFTHCVLFSLKHCNINSSNILRIFKQTAILCFSFRDNVQCVTGDIYNHFPVVGLTLGGVGGGPRSMFNNISGSAGTN